MGSLLPYLLHFCDCDLSGDEAIFPRLILLHPEFLYQQPSHLYIFPFICSLHVILVKH